MRSGLPIDVVEVDANVPGVEPVVGNGGDAEHGGEFLKRGRGWSAKFKVVHAGRRLKMEFAGVGGKHFLLRGRRFGQDVTQALRGVVIGRVKLLRAAERGNRRDRVAFRDRFVSLAQLDRGNLLPETLRGRGVEGILWRDGQGSLQLLQCLLELAAARKLCRLAVEIVRLLVVRAGDAAGGEAFIVVGAGWRQHAGRRILAGVQSAWEQHCRQQ